MKCVICRSKATFWNKVNKHKIYECKSCKHGFVYPLYSLEKVKNIYSFSGHGSKEKADYQMILEREEIYPNSSVDATRIVKNFKHISQGTVKNVLDVGAGFGFLTRELVSNNFTVDTLEFAPQEREILKKITGVDSIDLPYEEYEPDLKYDAVFMSQVLEHSYDPSMWADKTASNLRNGGYWIIAVPNFVSLFRFFMGKKEFYIIPPVHLNFFSYKSSVKMLENYGFEIVYFETISRLPFHKYYIFKGKYNPFRLTIIFLLKVIDKCRLGMMLNIYARKIG